MPARRRRTTALLGAALLLLVLVIVPLAVVVVATPGIEAASAATATAAIPEVPAAEEGEEEPALPPQLDETKLGSKLLVVGRDKGVDAWRQLAGVAGRWAQKAAGVFPASDAECDWNWAHLRCYPTDQCHFKYQVGDWHLGRSCRLMTGEEQEAAAARQANGKGSKRAKLVAAVRGAVGTVVHKVEAGRGHVAHHTGEWLSRAKRVVTKHQPPSDPECYFDVRRSVQAKGMVCLPADACQWRPKFGDLSPNHACRYRGSEEDGEAEAEA